MPQRSTRPLAPEERPITQITGALVEEEKRVERLCLTQGVAALDNTAVLVVPGESERVITRKRVAKART